MHAGFQGITANLSIDGNQSVTATLPPPTPPSYQTPNVSLFDVQLLPSADHTATISLSDWDNGTTSLFFDYALINQSYVESPVFPTHTFPPFPDPGIESTPESPLETRPADSSTTVIIYQSSTLSSTSPRTFSTFIGSTYTPGATSSVSNTESRSAPSYFHQALTPSTSVNLGAVVGGACGGLAALIAIATAIIFLKKRKYHLVALEESCKPDPFPATPAPARPLVTHPPTDEKTRMRLATRNSTMYHSHRQPDGDLSDFHNLSAIGDAGRASNTEAGPSTTDSSLLDDFVVDCRCED